jgi:hypothetical protein
MAKLLMTGLLKQALTLPAGNKRSADEVSA